MPSPPTPTPAPLSVAIICKNNERSLPRTLGSVGGWPAEIVAIDSGSTDGTIPLLEAAGARVVHQDWLGHVRQKQVALDACAQPWILSLDSDESVEPGLRDAILDAVARDDPTVAGYEVNRKVHYAGRFLDHAWQPEWRLRLVRAGRTRWAGYDPHDRLEPVDPAHRVDRLPGVLRHDSIESIAAFLAKQAQHADIAARSYERMGRRGSVARLVTSPLGAFAKQAVLKSAWRDGWRGWVAASTTAAAALMKHAALLERTRAPDRSEGERP
jgi:glycosyltransferase involved in cell wall biosynthesis